MIITNNQMGKIDAAILNQFIERISAKLKKSIINSPELNEVKTQIKELIEVGTEIGLRIDQEYYYFLYLCIKHSIKKTNMDSEVKEILTYPMRTNEDKLFNFHYYLENK